MTPDVASAAGRVEHTRDALLRAVVASTCLALSGAGALVYEVCWIRMGALVLGSTTLATSTLLAVFFAGLATGSHLFGRASARVRAPLRLYAVLEVGVAALAIASPWLFTLADPVYGAIHRTFATSPALLAVLRAALIGVVLLPPTILMGASLPLLCTQVRAEPQRIVGSVALLYAANTLGAAVGCAVAGVVLIPALGIGASVAVGAAASTAAGLLALALGDVSQPVAPPPEPRSAARAEPSGSRVIAPLFFLAGFAGLAYEVLWTRFLALVLRNTVYTYTISLTVVLLGIVAGSLVAPLLAREARASGRAFGALQALAGLYVLVLLLLPPAWWQGVSDAPVRGLALFLPAAILSGASFPLAIRAVAGSAHLGAVVGRMAAINTLGGIAGSLAAGFLLLPRLGLGLGVRVTTGVSIAVGVAAWLAFAGARTVRRDLVLAALALAAWAMIPGRLATRLPADFLSEGGVLVDFREGLAANAAVVRSNGLKQLRVDRWWQGEERKTHQIVAAHVPMLLHPGAARVLVVGAGAGQTARRFLDYPIERLDVVEIEPAVLDLVREHFPSGWMSDPRVELLRDDGRNVVAHTDRTYDVISLEVGQVLRPGVAAFYTADFYARARARLSDGGLLCQFVPLAFLTGDELRRVVATFLESFPASVLWYNTSELLLIGARGDSLRLDERRLDLLATDPKLSADLQLSYWGDRASALNQPDVLLGGFLAGAPGLRALAAGAASYRDDHPVLEYETSRDGRSRTAELAIEPLLRAHLDPFDVLLGAPLEAARDARARARRERNLADLIASALVRAAEERAVGGDVVSALVLLDQALQRNPASVPAHRLAGNVLVVAGRLEEARQRYEEALRLAPDDALALRGMGRLSLLEKRTDDALGYYTTTLALRPDDAETRNNLGALLASRQDYAGALVHFREAARLDPGDRGTRDNLARLEALLGAGATSAK